MAVNLSKLQLQTSINSVMKSHSTFPHFFLIEFILIFFAERRFCESQGERTEREALCGLSPTRTGSFPWYVILKLEILLDPGGSSTKEFYTGTLVSNRFVVTAAEIFDVESDRDEPEQWKAFPGAYGFHAAEIANLRSTDWIDVTRIEIHPLYRGYLSDEKQ